MPTTLSILTPPDPGAIGVLQLQAYDPAELELHLARAALPIPPVAGVRVASIAGVDLGVIIRWTPTTVHLMPHAGPAVIAEIVRRLRAHGIPLVAADTIAPRRLFPESRDEIEARMLLALSHAASPRAIDLLLDQPRRWRAHEAAHPIQRGADASPRTDPSAPDPALDRILGRLLTPPTVVAVGPPNVGKSTLCNALAGRCVAIVADEPGTTRDHVGVLLDLDGLVVRYVDTPGMALISPRQNAPPEEADAVAIARPLIASADLILLCGDATAPPLPIARPSLPATLTLALRADLGPASFRRDLDLTTRDERSIAALAHRIRHTLVPDSALLDPRPWRFW